MFREPQRIAVVIVIRLAVFVSDHDPFAVLIEQEQIHVVTVFLIGDAVLSYKVKDTELSNPNHTSDKAEDMILDRIKEGVVVDVEEEDISVVDDESFE